MYRVAQGKVSTWIILKTTDFGEKFRNRLILTSQGTHNIDEPSDPTSPSLALAYEVTTLLQDEIVHHFKAF
jgi:hypothetical protein